MIGIITTLLPYILIFFMFYKALKFPIFFMGIPFLMFLRNSIFMEHVKFLYKPESLGADISLLLWLTVFWTFATKRIYIAGSYRLKKDLKWNLNCLDYMLIAIIIITIYGFLMVSFNYQINKAITIQFIILLGLSIGYFFIKDIILNNGFEVLQDFLKILVIINTIAAFLFILHQGLHINIYQGEEYLEETFNGQVITRSFWFMPSLLPFSIIYLLVFENKKSILFIAMLVLNVVAIFITYSRSLLVNVVIITIIYFILDGIKNKNIFPILKNMALMVVGAAFLFFALKSFMPNNTEYFLTRFLEIKDNPQSSESNSLLLRLEQTSNIISSINVNKLFFGCGPITESESYLVSKMNLVTSDLVWTGVFFRWGIVGFIILVAFHIFSLFGAFFNFIKSDEMISRISLLVFLMIVSQILEGFASWTFLKTDAIALGFWYFSLISAIISFRDSSKFKNI